MVYEKRIKYFDISVLKIDVQTNAVLNLTIHFTIGSESCVTCATKT